MIRRDGFDVLGHNVDFQIDNGANLLPAHDHCALGISDQGNGKRVTRTLCNGEAGAVNCYVAFLDNVRQQSRRRSHRHPQRVAFGLDTYDLTRAVHMALNIVAAEPAAEGQRPLQIDRIANLQETEICSAQGLGADTNREAGLIETNNR